eukprot:3548058-Rhodomonas_salina.1
MARGLHCARQWIWWRPTVARGCGSGIPAVTVVAIVIIIIITGMIACAGALTEAGPASPCVLVEGHGSCQCRVGLGPGRGS